MCLGSTCVIFAGCLFQIYRKKEQILSSFSLSFFLSSPLPPPPPLWCLSLYLLPGNLWKHFFLIVKNKKENTKGVLVSSFILIIFIYLFSSWTILNSDGCRKVIIMQIIFIHRKLIITVEYHWLLPCGLWIVLFCIHL